MKNIKPQLLATLSKEYRESRKQDKQEHVLDTLNKDLDLRDRWLGIEQLKSKYSPTPYHNKDRQGQHIRYDQRADKAAEHVSRTQWSKTAPEDDDTHAQQWNRDYIIDETSTIEYNTSTPTISGIKEIIKKLKRKRATRPNEAPI